MSTADAAPLDAARCPLCSGPNGCALEAERADGQPQGPCWCTRARFGAALMARIPKAALGRACVCVACAGAGQQ